MWRHNGTPIAGNPSAAAATLTITNVQPSDAGFYDCVVTNACGSVTSDAAALDVYCDCAQQFTFAAGINDNFQAPPEPAAPSPALLAALSRPVIDFDQIPGVTPGIPNERYLAHTFSGIPPGISAASLTFRVRAGAGGEGNHTDLVRLGFADAGGLNARWSRRFGYYGGDDGIVFASPFQWEEGDTATVTLDLADLPNADGSSVSILAELASRGFLDLLVTDDSGVDYAVLTVTGAGGGGTVVAWIGEQPGDVLTCGGVGSSATFRVTTGGIGGPFTYQWRKNGVNLSDEPNHVSGATTATLVIANTTGSDEGNYDCLVIGANTCTPEGIVSDAAALTICPADFNCDGFLDFFDIDAFVTAFESGDAAADFNGDGFLDFFDADAFVEAFEAGC